MKVIKILLGILAALVIVLAIVVLLAGAHLGELVKAGIESAGPKMTGTPLTVEEVNLSLLGGSAGVKNLVIGNPDGYTSPQSISVTNASISLAPGSVLSDKIIIHSIEIRAPQITFEGNPLGANNLKQIMANVNGGGSAGGSAARGGGATLGTNAPAASEPAGQAKAGKKLEVDDILITGATVHGVITGLINREVTLPIPDIHITDLGKGPDGITAGELTQKILDQVTAETIQALVKSVGDLGKGALQSAKGALQNAGLGGTNALNQLKTGLGGLFGK